MTQTCPPAIGSPCFQPSHPRGSFDTKGIPPSFSKGPDGARRDRSTQIQPEGNRDSSPSIDTSLERRIHRREEDAEERREKRCNWTAKHAMEMTVRGNVRVGFRAGTRKREGAWKGGTKGRSWPAPRPWSRTVPNGRPTSFGRALEKPIQGGSEGATDTDRMMEDMKAFLQVDLENLFNERGIDRTKYQEEMEFEDPITSYSTLSGYLLNIQMLRYVFNPKFQLHSVERTGTFELTTRWTMKMEFFGKFLPTQLWRPEIAFTGVSIMQVNPETGKFCKHVDRWDSIADNSYFSTEGLQDLLRQVTQIYQTPDLESPSYTVLRRFSDYEIRLYDPYQFAEAQASDGRSKGEAFMKLAGFIFGENQENKKLAMTTPVYTTRDSLQFVIGSDAGGSAITPVREDIKCASAGGGVYAAVKFNGLATDGEVQENTRHLLRRLEEDGYPVGGEELLAQYNDPGTLPFFRRNEVLVPLAIEASSLLKDA